MTLQDHLFSFCLCRSQVIISHSRLQERHRDAATLCQRFHNDLVQVHFPCVSTAANEDQEQCFVTVVKSF